jgi:hypothetical protein
MQGYWSDRVESTTNSVVAYFVVLGELGQSLFAMNIICP